MSQQRLHPRYAAEVAVELRTEELVCKGSTVNVSEGGLCANVDAAVPNGSEVQASLSLILVADGAISEPVEITARVVWCTAIGDLHQVGLSFLPMSPATRDSLEILLQILDSRNEGA